MPSLQETFDTVVAHLRKQGKQAKAQMLDCEGDEYVGCAYRTPEGLKCAAGFLLPDELYHPDMEGKNCNPNTAVGRALAGLGYHLPLVEALQGVHDNSPTYWEPNLARVAGNFKLSYTAVENSNDAAGKA